jgi:hypothetical protein
MNKITSKKSQEKERQVQGYKKGYKLLGKDLNKKRNHCLRFQMMVSRKKNGFNNERNHRIRG